MKFSARKLAWSGVLIALAIVLKLPILSVPNVEFLTFVIFSSGYLLGMIEGMIVGIISMSIYTSLITPYGLPPLPIAVAQILSMALVGFAGGLADRFRLILTFNSILPYLSMGIAGLVLTIIYDLLTNMAAAYVMGQFYPIMVAAVPFAAIHILSNLIIFIVLTPLLLKMSKIQHARF
jgi:hypothetical protein